MLEELKAILEETDRAYRTLREYNDRIDAIISAIDKQRRNQWVLSPGFIRWQYAYSRLDALRNRGIQSEVEMRELTQLLNNQIRADAPGTP